MSYCSRSVPSGLQTSLLGSALWPARALGGITGVSKGSEPFAPERCSSRHPPCSPAPSHRPGPRAAAAQRCRRPWGQEAAAEQGSPTRRWGVRRARGSSPRFLRARQSPLHGPCCPRFPRGAHEQQNISIIIITITIIKVFKASPTTRLTQALIFCFPVHIKPAGLVESLPRCELQRSLRIIPMKGVEKTHDVDYFFSF